MFYYPNRSQAIRIQQTLETLYHGLNGEYFYGDDAWNYIHRHTGIDLRGILEKIAQEIEQDDQRRREMLAIKERLYNGQRT